MEVGDIEALRAEVAKLRRINRALMNRVEEVTDQAGEGFSLFHSAVALERKVRERTQSLERMRSELERSNTELRDARDAAESAVHARNRFLANMSHEIRTPMTGILGILQLVLDAELPRALRTDLEVVHASARSMLALLNDILDLSKLEAEKVELESIRFSPERILEDIAELFAESAQTKGLEIYTVFHPDAPRLAEGDMGRIRQVLSNLVGNAVKFTAEGSVGIEVDGVPRPDGGCDLRWSVIDTGIGISSEQQPLLFNPFTQADTSTTRKFGGTGLGLAICAQIARVMHGRIEVDSAPGEGSRFVFTAPATRHDSPAPPRLPGRPSVLVAVCGFGPRRGLIAQLRALGANPSAWNVEEAPSAMPPGSFDVVLVDERVPDVVRRACRDVGTLRLWLSTRRSRAHAPPEFGGTLHKPVKFDRLAKRLLGTHTDDQRREGPGSRISELDDVDHVRVLVVEDNEVNQKVALRSLQRLGVRASLANNGKRAVAAWETETFDLILMDCQMPEMDGFEATRHIRAAEPGDRRVPIIAMTGNALSGDREACLEAGMDDHIAKPVTLQLLRDTLARWLTQAA